MEQKIRKYGYDVETGQIYFSIECEPGTEENITLFTKKIKLVNECDIEHIHYIGQCRFVVGVMK